MQGNLHNPALSPQLKLKPDPSSTLLHQVVGGRYQVLDILGLGGFGKTYVSADLQRPGHPKCVLKHLHFSSQDEEMLKQARRMFAQEAVTLERLGTHDQIPQLLAYFEEAGEFYLVQELVAGYPLAREILEGTALTEAQTVELLEDVLCILDFVHGEGVIHRDLKPENLIRRQRDRRLVMIDFGAVKSIGLQIQPWDSTHSIPVYTTGYAASEQCFGKPQFNSDLYSLGMIAIQCLTGTHPTFIEYDPKTGEALWQELVQVDGRLMHILEKMTAYRSSDRYSTAQEVLEALDPLIHEMQTTQGENLQGLTQHLSLTQQSTLRQRPSAPRSTPQARSPQAQARPQATPRVTPRVSLGRPDPTAPYRSTPYRSPSSPPGQHHPPMTLPIPQGEDLNGQSFAWDEELPLHQASLETSPLENGFWEDEIAPEMVELSEMPLWVNEIEVNRPTLPQRNPLQPTLSQNAVWQQNSDLLAVPSASSTTSSSASPPTSPTISSQPKDRLPKDRLWKWPAAIGGGLLVGSLGVVTLFHPSSPVRQQLIASTVFGSSVLSLASDPGVIQAESPEMVDRSISVGDRILLPKDGFSNTTTTVPQNSTPLSLAEVKRLRDRFVADPEALIYLNNLEAGTEPTHEIAAVLPFSQFPEAAAEVLRGIAQAQTQLNRQGGLGGKRVTIVLADDRNQPDFARKIAQRLSQRPNLLGIIGHGSSDTTLAAAAVYKTQRLVTIAPISSATQLSSYSPYLFRTMPSDRLPAKALGQYMRDRLKKRRAIVFFNSTSTYSQSLKSEFKNALFYTQSESTSPTQNSGETAEIIAEIDLSKPDFNPAAALKSAVEKKAEVIVLANGLGDVDRALLILQLNQNRLPILAGDALYSETVRQVGSVSGPGLTLAIPAQQLGLAQSKFQQQAKQLWRQSVSWRTALAYDATLALTQAIAQASTNSQQPIDREQVRAGIARSDFQVMGSVRPIRFMESGDPREAIQLVTLRQNPHTQQPEFMPLNLGRNLAPNLGSKK